jgi:hypothetical protein
VTIPGALGTPGASVPPLLRVVLPTTTGATEGAVAASLAAGITSTSRAVESATERAEKTTSAQATSMPITSAEANHTSAPNASGQPAGRVAREAPPGGSAPAPGPCSRQAERDDCLEGAAISGSSQVAVAPPESAPPGPQVQNPGDVPHASVRANAQQEKVQSSRQSWRALRQAPAEQRPLVDKRTGRYARQPRFNPSVEIAPRVGYG